MSANLAEKLANANVTKLLFIRHANAAPPGGKKKSEYNGIHDWQKDDQMRPLTDKGKQQGAVARKWFQADIGVPANKVLVTSGARRASETLQALAEQEAKKQGFLAGFFGCSGASTVGMEVGMDLLPSLHPAGIAPECEELFDKHGYAPLAKFYAMEGGEAAYAKYAEVVAGEMCHLCDKVAMNPGSTLSFFGHAVFLNAVAMMVITKAWPADDATIAALKDLDLGEAEGIELSLEGSVVAMKHRTVRPHPLWQ